MSRKSFVSALGTVLVLSSAGCGLPSATSPTGFAPAPSAVRPSPGESLAGTLCDTCGGNVKPASGVVTPAPTPVR